MAVPKKLLIDIESYPRLTFLPLGRKNRFVRSLANDYTKGLLARLNKTVEKALNDYEEEDIRLLQIFLYNEEIGGIPIPITKQEEVYPYLWKADAFLWRTFSEQKGIPIHSHEFDETSFVEMTKEQLDVYIKRVVKSYMFCARIHDTTRQDWLGHVNKRFYEHPLVSLYHRNKEDILAIENVKTSPLLFLMKDPDRIAFWRSRIEVMMRPFRSMPLHVFNHGVFSCPHEMNIALNEHEETMHILCDKCEIDVTYHVVNDVVTFKHDFNIMLTSKRLATTKRQFDEIIQTNSHVMDKLHLLQKWQQQLLKQQSLFSQLNDICYQINEYKFESNLMIQTPLLAFLFKLKRSSIPNSSDELITLPWFSKWQLDDVAMLNEGKKFDHYLKAERLTEYLSECLKEARDILKETKKSLVTKPLQIGRIKLSPTQLCLLLQLIKQIKTTETQQTYIAILSGNLSSNLRRKQYDQLDSYKILKHLKPKYFLTLFSQLQEWKLVQKERVGFSLTMKGESILQLFIDHQ
ncbi:RQC-minor-2 family DNA-binding protein [Bacillus sp. CGMCC 1.16541]|uniref:RQC-minor-2 family DNA-binding protein n=1 Tax=Bacillus sp. CGMCC 1.16541 TaxID=2185143 RepID=UPI000D73DA5A|nr:RQC-minor-2 family DNA-binding protein [Bacillus sp. CGMCC 1.16541]